MRYGLIGETLCHSYSPEIHRLLHGEPYELCPLKREELPEFFRRREFEGINVTIPYKKEVLCYCDTLSETARRAGCVNTIVKGSDGRLHGDNTDLDGLRHLLSEAEISLKAKHILILGSGGASLTAQLAAAESPARSVTVVTRGELPAAAQLGAHAQVIINATPLGMYPHAAASPVDLARFPAAEAAIDLIYHPLRTRFLQQAEALGLRTANGLSMLTAQAAAAAALFFGGATGLGAPQAVTEKMRKRLENWVLIGMPGSGKSTLGAALARRSGREFIDLDAAIEAQAGMSCAELLRQKGEAALREIESEAAARYGSQTGLVIATGGGTVLREENVMALRQNGRLLWIRRDPALLATENRPLSRDLPGLLAQREPAYKAAADAIVQNDSTQEALQEAAWREFTNES